MDNTANHYLDPSLYPDHDVFRPERFLEIPDAPIFSYGTGSRMCVAATLANRQLYLIFLRLISCFKIELVDDIDVDAQTGNRDPRDLIARVKPYQARFVPRDRGVLEELIV